ncbi:MAG: hypothetical protein QM516_10995, partial [Limnohabitans sp.]|nr:hypothetical protein [Limnohabitans sp.]
GCGCEGRAVGFGVWGATGCTTGFAEGFAAGGVTPLGCAGCEGRAVGAEGLASGLASGRASGRASGLASGRVCGRTEGVVGGAFGGSDDGESLGIGSLGRDGREGCAAGGFGAGGCGAGFDGGGADGARCAGGAEGGVARGACVGTAVGAAVGAASRPFPLGRAGADGAAPASGAPPRGFISCADARGASSVFAAKTAAASACRASRARAIPREEGLHELWRGAISETGSRSRCMMVLKSADELSLFGAR